jgi:DNA mismatch repair ATPase MutS
MTYIEIWNKLKGKPEYKEIIFLFKSGIFYRAYNTDAGFLSSRFWLRLVNNWTSWFAWFPISAKEKRLNQLKEWDFSYKLLEVDDNRVKQIESFDWKANLVYDKERVVFEKNTDKTKQFNRRREVFWKFLDDVENLVQKYKIELSEM